MKESVNPEAFVMIVCHCFSHINHSIASHLIYIHLPILPMPLGLCPMEFVRILDFLSFDRISHFLLQHNKRIRATVVVRAVTAVDLLFLFFYINLEIRTKFMRFNG